jgi:hypothetical protein
VIERHIEEVERRPSPVVLSLDQIVPAHSISERQRRLMAAARFEDHFSEAKRPK